MVGVVCCLASRETSIWFFWQRGLMPGLLLAAGLAAVDDAPDDATEAALDDTCCRNYTIIINAKVVRVYVCSHLNRNG